MEKDRIIYYDYLRVFAIIAVIVLHVAAKNWYILDGRSFEWNILNFYNSIVRWGVPIFLMISGSIFLSRKIEIKQLYFKYILRMIVAYFVWATFYAIIPVLLNPGYDLSLKSILFDIIGGSYHMWFIPTIIGIYMCVPLIRQIIQSKELTKYFLILSFVFAFVIPEFVNLSKDFIGGWFFSGINAINGFFTEMNMHFVLGYIFYFVLGYVLSNIKLTKKQRKLIYILGIIGFVSTILLNAVVTWKSQELCKTYYGNFNVNIVFEAVAVFTLFKYKIYSNKLNVLINKLSKYIFGVYLVHVFFIDILAIIGLDTLTFNPLISVPIIALIVVILSFLISYLLNKIPFINKWIV